MQATTKMTAGLLSARAEDYEIEPLHHCHRVFSSKCCSADCTRPETAMRVRIGTAQKMDPASAHAVVY